MAKFWTYTIIIAGLMIFFYFAGLTTLTGRVIQFAINTVQNYSSIWLWAGILILFSALIATTIRISAGFISTQGTEIAARTTFASIYLILFVSDLTFITKTAYESAGYFAAIVWAIMIPLIYGYILATIDWIGGHD